MKKILLWNGASSWGNRQRQSRSRSIIVTRRSPGVIVWAVVETDGRGQCEPLPLQGPPQAADVPAPAWPALDVVHAGVPAVQADVQGQGCVWKATTIVAPYERWQYHDENVKFNEHNPAAVLRSYVQDSVANVTALEYTDKLQCHNKL